MELSTVEKIRVMAKRKNVLIGDVAEGTGQTRQNFSNKLKRGDLKETEMKAIAECLGYELKITFVDKENGEEI